MVGPILERVYGPWLACLGIILVLASPSFAGSAGIRNGAIQGVVYDDFGRPLDGVSVVAVRTESPPVIRNTVTDAMGNFFLGNLYLGTWTVGYAKFGFETIDTSTGSPNSQTAIGRQVRVYVDSGQTTIAPAVYLKSLPDGSNGTAKVTVLDSSSGGPVTDATVILGAETLSSGSADGVYSLSTPALYDDQTGLPKPQALFVLADGFVDLSQPVTVVPKQNQNVTVRLTPLLARIAGTVGVTAGIPGVDLSRVQVRVRDLGTDSSSATVGANGDFSVSVPCSTSSITRRFTLEFILPGFKMGVVNGVTSPRSGTVTVPQPVVLEPELVDVTGQVIVSTGGAPQGSAYDTVIVVELGRAVTITGGTYLVKLPVGRPLTLKVTAKNPSSGVIESAQTSVTPVSDGSANPVYNVPLIVTNP